MSQHLIIRPEAEADLVEAALWQEKQESGLVGELIAEVHAAIQRALQSPHHYPCLRNKPEVRRVLTHRFPCRIFYIVGENVITVFALIHAARHDRR